MPWENIGDCGSGQLPNDRDWIVHCYEMAVSYLKFILGDPPEGCELGIMWHEHELGDYPSVGVHWDSPQSDAPWEYINKCETLLMKFDEAVNWYDISPDRVYEDIDELEDDDNDTE